MQARTRLIEQLPAVFRQDEVNGTNFLGHFLQAFQGVFDQVQDEVDAIPDLFALLPTPVLAGRVTAGTNALLLDSAAGLCSGDVLHIKDVDVSRIEFVEVLAVSADLLPTSVTVTRPLRFDHEPGTPLRLVGRPRSATTLSQTVSQGAAMLTVLDRPPLEVAPGEVLRLGDEEAAEHVQVIRVERIPTADQLQITVAPALQHRHVAGQPIARSWPASQATPPLAFANASRSGPELVLRTAARAGEAALELDTVIGLTIGDILHLRDPDPTRVEFVRLQAKPAVSSGPNVMRFAVQLSAALRFGHEAGIDIGVVGAPVGDTELLQPAEPATLRLKDPDSPGIVAGDVLQVGTGNTSEYVQVLARSGQTITITPPLQQPHATGQRVLRLSPSGSGIDFLRWLAGWLGVALRPAHGERWNRELLRLAGRIWPWRGTKAGVEASLNAALGNEARATVFDPSNPFQIGLASTVGLDTIICGGPPHFFWVDLDTEARYSRLYHPVGLSEMIQAVRQVLHRERPAHTAYDLRLQAHTMQIGSNIGTDVGARVGDTTLLWEKPLIIPGDR